MGEKVDKRIHRTLQGKLVEPPHCREIPIITVWDAVALLWTIYLMRMVPIEEMELQDQKRYLSKMQIILANKITMMDPNRKARPTTVNVTASMKKRENREIYVRGVNSQWNKNKNNNGRDAVREQRINSNVESEKYSDITMVQLECCPNRERIERLQLSLGKLCRIGTLAGHAWTKEKPKIPCRFVVPNVQDKGETIPETMSHVSTSEKQDAEGRNNPLMIVEMIADKLDRKCAAEILDRHIESRNPTTYKCYLEDVKEYGFDHIILIGDCDTGILFLDCYGRAFEWEDSMDVLWSLGNYFSMAEKESLTRRVIWSVEYDGTIAEFDPMDDLQNELTSDEPATKTTGVHPVAKKKKNSKKKNSKKKQH